MPSTLKEIVECVLRATSNFNRSFQSRLSLLVQDRLENRRQSLY